MKKILFFFAVVAAAWLPAAEFTHPGVLSGAVELERIRAKLAAGAEPWAGELARLRAAPPAALTWRPKPRQVVEVGYYSKPDFGGSEERADSHAAYAHALLWALTGDRRHGEKAVEILDAWAILESHRGDNGPVQAAWYGSVFAAAAELMKHVGDLWPAESAERFGLMLRRAFVPLLLDGKPGFNGNWELSMCNALAAMAVFLDDRALFDRAIAMWRRRIPAYYYLESDGPLPVRPDRTGMSDRKLRRYWHRPGRFVTGLCQETCRDLPHAEMGLTAAMNTAEIARLQGIDLFAECAGRVVPAIELQAGFRNGRPVPPFLNGGKLETGSGVHPTYLIAYGNYAGRLGSAMPETEKLLRETIYPGRRRTSLSCCWETLTHASDSFEAAASAPEK